MNEDEKEREEELKSQQFAEWAGVHIPTNEEKMTSALESISFDMQALGGISEKIKNLDHHIEEKLEKIINELEESRKSATTLLELHHKSIDKILDYLDIMRIGNRTAEIEEQLEMTNEMLERIGEKLNKQKRSFSIPILLSLILIVLLIK